MHFNLAYYRAPFCNQVKQRLLTLRTCILFIIKFALKQQHVATAYQWRN